ncbi:MAG: 5-(carboxyamino)imidazole ribonucleotide mutase [Bdellovibrionota bacterium]|nr:5-(carboxyamino)imidazole ribonucleotide mutase [Bdellovibrionota bacterium]
MSKDYKVAIIMGSSSDLPTMQGALDALDHFTISYDVKIVSAHRTPQGMLDFATSAREKGYNVIIAGAGGAAHLPGMVASATTLPVIGIPVNSKKSIEGIDSLLSIVQMPAGIPVATMAVDGSFNGGLMAVRILGASDEELASKLKSYEQSLVEKVNKMNEEIS